MRALKCLFFLKLLANFVTLTLKAIFGYFVPVLAFITLVSSTAFATMSSNKCAEIFNRDNLPNIHWGNVEDFIPETYLSQLREQNIELSLEIKSFSKNNLTSKILEKYQKNHQAKNIALYLIKNKYVPIGKIELTPDPKDPKSIQIDGLNLVDPRPNTKSQTTHQTQKSKGMPFYVFQSFKRKLLIKLKEAGYEKIQISGSQDYTVLQLYRKTLQAQLKTQTGQAKIAYLEHVYKILKNQTTHPFELNNLDQFSKILRSYNEYKDQFFAEELLWKSLSQKKREETYGFVYNDSGDLIAVYRKNFKVVSLSQFFIIDPFSKNQNSFVNWMSWSEKNDLALEVSL